MAETERAFRASVEVFLVSQRQTRAALARELTAARGRETAARIELQEVEAARAQLAAAQSADRSRLEEVEAQVERLTREVARREEDLRGLKGVLQNQDVALEGADFFLRYPCTLLFPSCSLMRARRRRAEEEGGGRGEGGSPGGRAAR